MHTHHRDSSTNQRLSPTFALPAGTLYLDTASQGPRLRAVHDAAEAALAASITPWRLSGHDWIAAIELVRSQAATLFDGEADAVAFIPSAAYGLAIAARNLPLAGGDAVLVLEGQFPSNLLVWQQRCADVGARLTAARRADGRDWTDAVLEALDADPRIRVLALPQAYWHDGALLDLDRIAARARERGAALVLDLSQSLGALPTDVHGWKPDFIVSVGHKWLLGAPGLAYLWAAPQWRERGTSIEQHWQARDGGDDWRFPVDRSAPYRSGARRYDAGGVTDPLRLAMADAALRQVASWGVAAVAAQLLERTAALETALRDGGLAQWLNPGPVAHFLGIRPPADAMARVGRALAAAEVVMTTRHGVLRIAPHLHLGVDDMRRVAAIMVDVA